METGLWSQKGPIPLTNVNITGTISHFTAQITISQTYENTGDSEESAVFRFPLDTFGALCGFEVVLDGKRITSQVKKRGESSLSNSQDLRKTDSLSNFEDNLLDTFTCDIGTLAPKKSIEFRLTYVTELSLEDESIRFFLPGVQSETPYKLNVSLEVTPFSIFDGVECPTHDVEVSNNGDAGLIQFQKGSSREGNLLLLMKLKETPKIWSMIEHDAVHHTYAAQIAFHPDIASTPPTQSEMIVMVDCSNVGAMPLIKSALMTLLEDLSGFTYFNLIPFGSSYHTVFPTSQPTNQPHNIQTAQAAIDKLAVISSQNIDLFAPLSHVLNTPPLPQVHNRTVFLFTGGLIPNTVEVLDLVSQHEAKTRFFTFGMGDHFSHLAVVGIARAGSGAAEFITGKSTANQHQTKISRQVQRAMQPPLTNLTTANIQFTPQRTTLYNKDNILLYTFLPNDIQQQQVTLQVTAPEGPLSFPLQLDITQAQPGKAINILTARSKMRDLEAQDPEANLEEIVRLGTTFQLASNYTSFVAVAEKTEKTRLSLHSSVDLHASSSREIEEEEEPARQEEPTIPTTPSGRKVYPADFLLRFRPLCTDMPEGLSQNLGTIVTPFNGKANNSNAGNKSPMVKGKNNRGGHRRTDSRDNKKGRNNKPNPNLGVAPLEATEGRWEPSTGRKVQKDQTAYDEKWRKVQGILNKLTAIKYEELYPQLLEIGIKDLEMLEATINLIFDKAVTEPHFCTMYANLCYRLTTDLGTFPGPDDKPVTFRTVLLTKCQMLFESKILPNQQALPSDPLDREEAETKIKRKTLGNIRFIGELYKEKMLSRVVILECIRTLLTEMDKPKEEDIESLCSLVSTIGKDLDTPANAQVLNEYYGRMEQLRTNMNLPSRIRFMLQNVLELRANGWVKVKGSDLKSSQEANRSDSLRASQERGSPPSSPSVRRGGAGRGLNKSQSADVVADEWETPKGSRKQKSKEPQWETRGNKGHARRSSAAPTNSPAPSRFAPKKTEEPKPKANPFSALSEDTPPGSPRSALRKSASNVDQPKKEVHITEPKDEPKENTIEDLENNTTLLIEEYFESADLETAAQCVRDLQDPSYHPDVVNRGFMLGLERRQDRDKVLTLFSYLLKENVINITQVSAGFSMILEMIEDLEIDIPGACDFAGVFMAHMMVVDKNALPLSYLTRSLSDHVDSGKASQIAATTFSTILQLKGEDLLKEKYAASKINFINFLPEEEREIETLENFLTQKGLKALL